MNNLLDYLINKGNGKFIFDMDGTITEARFETQNSNSLRILECENTENALLLKEYEQDTYKNIKVVQPVIKLFKQLLVNKCKVGVLTLVHNGFEVFHKEDCLNRIFPELSAREYMIGVFNSEHKFEILQYISTYENFVVYVDDSLNTLIDIEAKCKQKGVNNIYCFHISSIL